MKRLLWRYWDRYPVSLPLVYMCEHNGVVGLVNAHHYDDVVRQHRKERYQSSFIAQVPIAPDQVYRPSLPTQQVYLFTDKNVPEKNNRVGTLEQMRVLLAGFVVEYRDFELPSIKVGDVRIIQDGNNEKEEIIRAAETRLQMVRMWLAYRG